MTTSTSLYARFARFADAPSMRALLGEHAAAIFGVATEVRSCRLVEAAYKSYHEDPAHARATYAATWALQLEPPRHDALVYVKAYQGGRSRQAFAAFAQCEGVTHVAQHDLIVWRFPSDPRLPQLASALEPQTARAHLPYARLAPALVGPAALRGLRVEVVNYRAEQRCVLRYRAQHERGELELYAKCYADERGAAIDARLQGLWKAAQRSRRLCIAPPLGYDAERRTLWTHAVVGKGFLQALRETDPAPLLDAAAQGLAALHASALEETRVTSLSARLREIEKKSGKLARAVPSLTQRLDDLCGRLTESAQRLGSTETCPISGDFHLGQLLVRQRTVHFVDFDDAALGDPAQDVGNFVADLSFHCFDAERVERMSRRFIASYRRHAPLPVDDERIHWHALIHLIGKAFRVCLRPRADLTVDLAYVLAAIDRLEARLVLSSASRVPDWSGSGCSPVSGALLS